MQDSGSIPGWGRSPGENTGSHTLVFLHGEFHRQRSLAGYSLWGHKELEMTEWLTFTFSCYVLRLIFTSAWGKSFRFQRMKQLKFGIRSCDEKKKIFLFFFKIWKNELNRNYWMSIFSYNYLSGWKILLCFFRVIVRDHVNELYKLMIFLHLHLVFKRNNQVDEYHSFLMNA